MIIKHLVLGFSENNCYVLRQDSTSHECIILDTGLHVQPLMDFIQDKRLNPVALICTHGHVDHIAGIPAIREAFPGIEVAIHKNDSEMLTNSELNLSSWIDRKVSTDPADVIIESERTMSFAGLEFEVIETPGHTFGGVCFYFKKDNVLFSGDTLFAGSVGRTDFAGNDQQKCFEQLIENIRKKIFTLPEETKVYPGHGSVTSVRNEKQNNPYLANG